MSGRSFREMRQSESSRGVSPRAQLPLLDRLIDDDPDTERDPPMSSAEALSVLRRSVRRDLEALLNAHRRWRSWPAALSELNTSVVGFGIPDFTSGAFNDPKKRESLRAEIEAIIRRFEPRFMSVQVILLQSDNPLESTLRLRIDALLHADPAPDPVSFDTMVDASTAEVFLTAHDV